MVQPCGGTLLLYDAVRSLLWQHFTERNSSRASTNIDLTRRLRLNAGAGCSFSGVHGDSRSLSWPEVAMVCNPDHELGQERVLQAALNTLSHTATSGCTLVASEVVDPRDSEHLVGCPPTTKIVSPSRCCMKYSQICLECSHISHRTPITSCCRIFFSRDSPHCSRYFL